MSLRSSDRDRTSHLAAVSPRSTTDPDDAVAVASHAPHAPPGPLTHRGRRSGPEHARTRLDGAILGPTRSVATARLARVALSFLPESAPCNGFRLSTARQWTSRQLRLVLLMRTPPGSDFHARLLQRIRSRERDIVATLTAVEASAAPVRGRPLLDLPNEVLQQVVEELRLDAQTSQFSESDESLASKRAMGALLLLCRTINGRLREIAFQALLHCDVHHSGKLVQAVASLDSRGRRSGTAQTRDGRVHESSEQSRGLIAVIRVIAPHRAGTSDVKDQIDAIAVRLVDAGAAVASDGVAPRPAPLPAAQRGPVLEQLEQLVAGMEKPFDEVDRLHSAFGLAFDEAATARIFSRATENMATQRAIHSRIVRIGHVASVLSARAAALPGVDIPGVIGTIVAAIPARPEPLLDWYRGERVYAGSHTPRPANWDAAVSIVVELAQAHRETLDPATLEQIDPLGRQREPAP